MSERLPPHSPAIEQAVLGAMLQFPKVISDVVAELEPNHFYSERHAKIYRAMLDIYNSGTDFDMVIVADTLESLGQLSDIGGTGYVISLFDCVATEKFIGQHIEMLRDKAIKREMVLLGGNLSARSSNKTEKTEEIISDVDGKLLKLSQDKDSQGQTVSDLAVEMIEGLEDYCNERIGVKSGFCDLDRNIGMFSPANLILIAGRPSMGKTSFALNIAENASKAGKVIGFASIEMSKRDLMERLACGKADISIARLKGEKLKDEDLAKLVSEFNKCAENNNLIIYDQGIETVVRLRAEMKKLRGRRGLDLVFIDYLQLMIAEGENRTQQVTQISNGLKIMAKELGVPVIALSQLSRQADKGSPKLSDLRDSGSLEQDADVVLFIDRPNMRNQKPPDEFMKQYSFKKGEEIRQIAKQYSEIIIGKQRQGPAGITIPMWFFEEQTQFRSIDRSIPF